MVKSFCQLRKDQMGGHQVTHEFPLYPVPSAPAKGETCLKLEAQNNFLS